MRSFFTATIVAAAALVIFSARAASLTAVEDPKAAPQLQIQDLEGTLWSLEDFRGKVLMINFWATWCPPCVKELPSMQALWSRMNRDEFALIAINVGDDLDTVSDFLASFETPIDFQVLLDPDLTTVKRWPVFGLPTTFIVDSEGVLVYKALGEREWDDPEIEAEIISLIDNSQ